MRFEAREITAHANPVTAKRLAVGRAFFIVNFLDAELLIPEMRPLVFIGKGLASAKKGQFVFQDAPSYLSGVRLEQARKSNCPIEQHICSAAGLSSIYEFEAALDVMLRCSLRRAKRNSSLEA